MEDPKLEASIVQVQELIKIWQTYYRLLMAAFDKGKEFPADAEEQFQRVKNVVAEKHDQFSDVITKDHYVAQNILQMVKRTISIFDFEKASDVANDKTLIEWQEANILLFETLGSLEYRKHQLSKVSESEHKKQARGAKRKEAWSKLRANTQLYAVLKYGLILAVIAAVWFSPIRPWFVSIPFVTSRINDFRDIFGMQPMGEVAGEVKEIKPANLPEYVGRYRMKQGVVLSIEQAGDILNITVPDGSPTPMRATSREEFFFSHQGIEKRVLFVFGEEGGPTELMLGLEGSPKKWEKMQ